MKYLIILFSLYMTILTLMPCQDKEDISQNSTYISALQKPAKGIEHHGQETCAPFCNCACCSVSRHFPLIKEKIEINETGTIPYTTYRMPVIPEQSIEIDQPPRIA